MGTILISGNLATFTVKESAQVDRASLQAELEKRNMKLEGLRRERRPKAAAAYVLTVEGLG